MINHSSQTIFIQANDLLIKKVWRFISVKEVHTVTFWWSRNHDRFRHSPKGCSNYNSLSQKWEFQNFLALNLLGLLVGLPICEIFVCFQTSQGRENRETPLIEGTRKANKIFMIISKTDYKPTKNTLQYVATAIIQIFHSWHRIMWQCSMSFNNSLHLKILGRPTFEMSDFLIPVYRDVH